MDYEKYGISFEEVKEFFFVFVNDNGCLEDQEASYLAGRFTSYAEAVDTCKQIVDDSLVHCGTDGESSLDRYRMFGKNPYIIGPTKDLPPFSAVKYAEQRCMHQS